MTGGIASIIAGILYLTGNFSIWGLIVALIGDFGPMAFYYGYIAYACITDKPAPDLTYRTPLRYTKEDLIRIKKELDEELGAE